MLLTASETHFFTDPRLCVEAANNITGMVHVVKGPLTAAVAAVIKRKHLKKIGFEASGPASTICAAQETLRWEPRSRLSAG